MPKSDTDSISKTFLSYLCRDQQSRHKLTRIDDTTMKSYLYLILLALAIATKANAQYKVGDYYENGTVKGIVIRVDNSGNHGLIMSLDKCAKKWLDDKDEKFNTNAYYEDDGEKNMAVIEKYIKENGKSWAMFPYFEWCRNHGEGWYAPALDELKDILNAINGGTGKYNAKYMKQITKTLKKHKGDGLIDSEYFGTNQPHSVYSSTEGDAGMVYTLFFKQNISSALLGGTPKGDFLIESMLKTQTGGKFANGYGSRAVRKF